MLLGFGLLWLLFGVAAALAAANKNRNGCGWFLLGVLLGPFGLIFALLLPKIESPAAASPAIPDLNNLSLDAETRKCPQCAEIIKLEALKCRFCNLLFDPAEVARLVASRTAALQEQFAKKAAGLQQCPQCLTWDVHRAFIEDGGQGDWCPHCQKSLQKMRGEI